MKIAKAMFRQEALSDQLVESVQKSPSSPVLSLSKGPEVFLVLLTPHFSLLTGLENAAGGFFQQTRLVC